MVRPWIHWNSRSSDESTTSIKLSVSLRTFCRARTLRLSLSLLPFIISYGKRRVQRKFALGMRVLWGSPIKTGTPSPTHSSYQTNFITSTHEGRVRFNRKVMHDSNVLFTPLRYRIGPDDICFTVCSIKPEICSWCESNSRALHCSVYVRKNSFIAMLSFTHKLFFYKRGSSDGLFSFSYFQNVYLK